MVLPEILLDIIRDDAIAMEHHRAEIVRLGERRAHAAMLLHEQNWGYGRIATALGLSRPRAQQLVKAGEKLIDQINEEER